MLPAPGSKSCNFFTAQSRRDSPATRFHLHLAFPSVPVALRRSPRSRFMPAPSTIDARLYERDERQKSNRSSPSTALKRNGAAKSGEAALKAHLLRVWTKLRRKKSDIKLDLFP